MTYLDQAAQHAGKQVEMKGVVYTIGDLMEKTGKMKNGDEANYLALVSGEQTVELHPRRAAELFTKGETEGIKLLVAAVAESTQTADEKAKADAIFAQMEAAAANPTGAPAEQPATTPAAAPATQPAAEKKTFKKALCIQAYKDGVAANETRQQILARFSAVGVTGPGAATYYQNIKSQKEGWI